MLISVFPGRDQFPPITSDPPPLAARERRRGNPIGPVAQLAEQQTLNLRVVGSIPTRLTRFPLFFDQRPRGRSSVAVDTLTDIPRRL